MLRKNKRQGFRCPSMQFQEHISFYNTMMSNHSVKSFWNTMSPTNYAFDSRFIVFFVWLVIIIIYPSSYLAGAGTIIWLSAMAMGLLPLRMCRECQERFPHHRGLSNPNMHYGTCGTHMLWCMPGSLTSFEVSGGENVPGIPAACGIGSLLVRYLWHLARP